MAGFQRRLTESLQFRLSCWLLLTILLVALLAGAFSFVSAIDEVNDMQDNTLRQIAAQSDWRAPSDSWLDIDDDDEVSVQPLEGGRLPVPPELADGIYTLRLKGDTYRVLIRTLPDASRIAVTQETERRDEIAQASALRTLTPILILIPTLLLVVVILVRRMFRPISALAADLDNRSEQALHPLADVRLPTEIRPFVAAINRLLGRAEQSMREQRRFVADAAHELRSPLTALSLQAERLADAPMSDEAGARLAVLRQGIERGRNLLEQLLSLARVQSAAATPVPLSVMQVYRRVLEVMLPLAEARGIDLGVDSDSDAEVLADETDLTTLIKNLVDNAIRYTQSGGRVDLRLHIEGTLAVVQVVDNGPGIPQQEQLRVFDPFYRVLGQDQPGSGLGLAIVAAIAERLGANVKLSETDTNAHRGLCVEVRLPLFKNA